MEIRFLNYRISLKKVKKEALGAIIGYWYRIPSDPTDKVRLIYKTDSKNEKRCIRCNKSIRGGLVWDTHLVTPGFFNSFLDAPICTRCAPNLSYLLDSFNKSNIDYKKILEKVISTPILQPILIGIDPNLDGMLETKLKKCHLKL